MQIYLILLIYIIFIITISLKSRSNSKNLNNFIMGDRKAGGWLSAFSYGATYFSAVMFIGYAGALGWQFGLWAVLIGVFNAVIGTFLAWKVLAKRTRKITHELNVKTMPQFLSKKYDSNFLKYFSVIVIFLFLLPYSSSVYMGLTSISSVLLNIDVVICMISIAVLTGVIVLTGGYKTTLKADFFQGILLLGVLILLLIFIVNSSMFGGLEKGLDSLVTNTINLNLNLNSIISLVSIIVITSLGPWGLPQMINKFYAIKDEKEIKKATIVSSLFAFIVSGIGYFIGSLSIINYTSLNQLPGSGVNNTDYLVPNIILNSNVSELFYGFILILLIAASVSTLSSITLSASSTLSMDLISDFKKVNNVYVTKIVCLLFVLLSFIIALLDTPILILMSYSWGILSATFIAPYLLSLYWKSFNKIGAIVGMLTGFVIAIIPLMCKLLDINITIGSFGLISNNGNIIACIAILVSFVACYVGTKTRKCN